MLCRQGRNHDRLSFLAGSEVNVGHDWRPRSRKQSDSDVFPRMDRIVGALRNSLSRARINNTRWETFQVYKRSESCDSCRSTRYFRRCLETAFNCYVVVSVITYQAACGTIPGYVRRAVSSSRFTSRATSRSMDPPSGFFVCSVSRMSRASDEKAKIYRLQISIN